MPNFIRKILLFSPLLFFAYTPWTLYPAIFGRSILFQILVEVILIALLVYFIFIGRKKISNFDPTGHHTQGDKFKGIFDHPIAISLIIFTLVQFISFIFSVDREASFWGSMSRMDGLFSSLHLLSFYFLLVLFLTDKKESEAPVVLEGGSAPEAPLALRAQPTTLWIKFFWINALIAGALSVLAVFQHFTDLVPKYILQSGRVYATFGNPVFFAVYLIFSIFFTLFLLRPKYFWRFGGNRQWLGVISLIVQVAALWLTGSQGSIGGLIAGILLVVFLYILRHQHRVKIIILFLLVSAILGGVIAYKSNFVYAAKTGNWSAIEGLESRLIVWKMGWQAWKERPIFGWGPSTFELAFDKYYDPELLRFSFYETVSTKPHNIIIETLVHFGLIGLVSYLFLFVAAILALWRLRQKDFSASVFGSGLLIAYVFNLQFAFDTTNSLFMLVAFLAYLTDATRITRMHSNDSKFITAIQKIRMHPNDPKKLEGRHLRKNKFVSVFLCSGVLVIAAAWWFGNLAAWAASAPAAKAENEFWFAKPVRWADEVKKAVGRGGPYQDEIRVILAQDLIAWEASGALPVVEVKDQIEILLEKLTQSAASHPLSFQNNFMAGQVMSLWAENFDAAKLTDAEAQIRKTLVISPKRQAAHLVLGKILLNQGKMVEAEEAARAAVHLYNEAPEPHWFLGVILAAAGRPALAVEEFKLAEKFGYEFRPQELRYWQNIDKQLHKINKK